jgi:hypothetical protein
MYIKVNTSLRREDANHCEEIHKVDTMIFHRGSLGYHQASPRCVDQHLVVRRLIGVHNRAPQRRRKNLPQVW